MIGASRHLMGSGFEISYAYTQSDEISLLFDPTDVVFGHKHRKLLSVLAGEASVSLTLALGCPVSVDCRLLELESTSDVIDYFMWRQVDAERNCLQAYVYATLRQSGSSARSAQRTLKGKDRAEQAQLLQEHTDIDYELVPAWQRRGVGLYHEKFVHEGLNPITGEKTPAVRRRVKVDSELPRGDEYRRFLDQRIDQEPV